MNLDGAGLWVTRPCERDWVRVATKRATARCNPIHDEVCAFVRLHAGAVVWARHKWHDLAFRPHGSPRHSDPGALRWLPQPGWQ